MSRFLLSEDELESVIEHAQRPTWNREGASVAELVNYIGERYAGLAISPDSEGVRKRIMFYAGVLGVLSGIEGEKRNSAYDQFERRDSGNQVDEFLDKIGYRR